MSQLQESDRRSSEPRPRRRPRGSRGKYPMTPSPGGRRPRRRRRRPPLPGFVLMAAVMLAAAALCIAWPAPGQEPEVTPSAPAGSAPAARSSVPPLTAAPEQNNTGGVAVPGWILQDFLPVNEWSRPGTPLPQVNGVVVHYVGNPGTTAEQNRSYFGYLADTHETYASSHFLVGIDGKVIQCVPLDEISYCSNQRNADTIAIECCHPDDSGQFTPETQASLIRLLDWLIDTYGLEREDVLRHYDVTGKECPRYYVQNPEEWAALLDALTFPGQA